MQDTLESPDTSMLIRYPNTVGDCFRYSLEDQRMYFNKFEGGAVKFFHIALHNILSGDLLEYINRCTTLRDLYLDQCEIIFNSVYDQRLQDNTLTKEQYLDENREFQRRVFDIYRYAKSSVGPLCIDKNNMDITKVWHNAHFDTGIFLIR